MSEIRYWNLGNIQESTNRTQNKKALEAVEKFDRSFQAELLGELSILDGDTLSAGMSSGFSSDLLGRNGPDLMNLDIDGIEKVWAAQMDSPLSSFGNFNSGSSSKDSNGLAGVVDLLVKEQIARARKQLEQQQQNYSFDEFVNDVSKTDSKDPIGQIGNKDIDIFVADINRRIREAAVKLDIPEAEIRKRLAG